MPRKSVALIMAIFLMLPAALMAWALTPAAAAENASIRVGVYQNKPKIFLEKRGKPAGLWIDLLERIGADQKWKFTYVSGNWSECLERLKQGEIDIMPDVAYSEEREHLFDFNQQAVLSNWAQLYARPFLSVESILDLTDRRIAVMKGGISFERFKLFNIPAQYILCDDYRQVFQAVDAKHADAGNSSGPTPICGNWKTCATAWSIWSFTTCARP